MKNLGQPQQKLRLLIKRSELVVGTIGVLFFIVLLVATGLGTISRYFNLGGFEWSFEIAGASFIWVTFLGAALAELRGENAGFDLLDSYASDRVKEILKKVRALLLLVVGVVFLKSSLAMFGQSAANPTAILRWPLGTQIAALVVGSLGIVAVALVRLIFRNREKQ